MFGRGHRSPLPGAPRVCSSAPAYTTAALVAAAWQRYWPILTFYTRTSTSVRVVYHAPTRVFTQCCQKGRLASYKWFNSQSSLCFWCTNVIWTPNIVNLQSTHSAGFFLERMTSGTPPPLPEQAHSRHTGNYPERLWWEHAKLSLTGLNNNLSNCLTSREEKTRFCGSILTLLEFSLLWVCERDLSCWLPWLEGHVTRGWFRPWKMNLLVTFTTSTFFYSSQINYRTWSGH